MEDGFGIKDLGFNPSHPARKRLSLHQLSSAKRLEIVKRAVSKQWTCQELAIIYNVKVQAIYDMKSDAKRRPA
jgi:hypothetical protein